VEIKKIAHYQKWHWDFILDLEIVGYGKKKPKQTKNQRNNGKSMFCRFIKKDARKKQSARR